MYRGFWKPSSLPNQFRSLGQQNGAQGGWLGPSRSLRQMRPTRIFGHNQSPFFAVSDQPTPTNQDAGRRIKRPIRLLPAIPTLIRCPPLSFACNPPPYQFLRKTSRKSLVRFVLSHPKLPRRPLLGGLQMQICLDSDFLIFAAIKVKLFYVSALPR